MLAKTLVAKARREKDAHDRALRRRVADDAGDPIVEKPMEERVARLSVSAPTMLRRVFNPDRRSFQGESEFPCNAKSAALNRSFAKFC